MPKVLVTGAGGYIGTQLVRDLLKLGHEVKAVDRFFFGKEKLREFISTKKIEIVQRDIRDLEVSDFRGQEIVFDLACLSNDPSGELDPKLTYQINRDGRMHVAKTAKNAGVRKYVISSSCSVYGKGSEPKLSEKSETNPISVYAKSTLDAEQHNLSISDNDFSVTSLRNATVFGLSNRMRFDLVVNLMTLTAFQKGRIIVLGGGKQWRPLVHVSDVSQAFLNVMAADNKKVSAEIFNIGLDNFQIINLAYLVKDVVPYPVEIEVAPDDEDKRDYNVVFDKAKNILDFEPKTDVNSGIKEIFAALRSGKVESNNKTNTVEWYKTIIQADELLKSIMLNGRVI